jgi:hypothetical protein
MTTPLAFWRRQPAAAAPSAELQAATSGKGFTIRLNLGPFVLDQPEPDWAHVAALVIAECKRAWEARAADVG